MAAAIALLLLVAVVAICIGRYPMSPLQVVDVLWSGATGGALDPVAGAIVWQIRLPRIGVAALVGAVSSAAGAAYQQLFRNPLVAPDTLGVSSGAALGAVVAILLGAGFAAIQVAAFAGGLAAVAIVMVIAARLTGHDPLVTLILTGVVVASLLGAGISFAKYVADPYNELPAITFWLMGSFAASTWRQLATLAVPALLSLAVLGALAWRIDLLALPEDEARALGVRTRLLRAVVVSAATLATAAAVAVSGIVGWVGLIVPHMARRIAGPEFSRLMPLAAIGGAAFMVVVDTLARVLVASELPPGILTAIVGAPLFIVLLARTRQGF